MKILKKHVLLSSIIFTALFLALIPVILSDNYLRQDDLMWEIWPGMRMHDFGYLYHNTVFQLVRPLCMLSFYYTDLLSIDIHHAVYVRLMALLLIGTLGIMLYAWQLLFNPNRILAATFAISAFTLPAYQVFAATGNYSLIITALVLTFIGAFLWYEGYQRDTLQTRRRYFYWGCLFFFASLLDYPLSSMYVWALLVICYLNTLSFTTPQREQKKRFFNFIAVLTVAMMIFYYVFGRLVHIIFHVHLNERSAVLNTHHLAGRLTQIFDVLSWHSDLWFWNNNHGVFSWPLLFIIGLLTAALIKINVLNGVRRVTFIVRNVVKSLIILFGLFFLAYSPVLASPELIITFRYAMVTMPILLYVIYWSTTILIGYKLMPITAAILIATTLFGMSYANLMLGDGIVGPHQHDFDYIQQQLSEKVLPFLKSNQPVLLHAIACDEGDSTYGENVPLAFEYRMRICQYQQQVIGVIIHSLNRFGYASNYGRHNKVIYQDKQIVVKNVPWGVLVVNSASNANNNLDDYSLNHEPIVTIDTRAIPPYQHLDFYRHIFAKMRTT